MREISGTGHYHCWHSWGIRRELEIITYQEFESHHGCLWERLEGVGLGVGHVHFS